MNKKILLAAALLMVLVAAQSVEARPRVFAIGDLNVEDVEGMSRTFEARILDDANLLSNVVWTLDGIVVQTNESVPDGGHVTYTDTAVVGNHELVVSASNAEGQDSGSWFWVVTPAPEVPIPEFPTMALPIAAVLGLMFLFSRKR